MANTKSSDIRYQVLDRCLRRGGFSTTKLMEAVNNELEDRGYPIITATNTIRNDMDHMAANHNVEIESVTDGKFITYRYAEPGMSIYKLSLRDDDFVQLSYAMNILSRFEGMNQMDWMNDFMARFRLSVDINVDNVPVVGFDDCSRLRGREYFSTLLSAICNRRVIDVEYKKYGAEESRIYTISPCYLKEHSRRWFLLGMTERHDKPIVLAFDRIESISENPGATYRPATGIDFNNGYFKDIVGVTRFHDQEPEEVLLEVDNERLQYLTTKPIHDSQELVETGEYTSILRLFVIPNVELAQFILSYGAAVRVISPRHFREYIMDEIDEMRENYEDRD